MHKIEIELTLPIIPASKSVSQLGYNCMRRVWSFRSTCTDQILNIFFLLSIHFEIRFTHMVTCKTHHECFRKSLILLTWTSMTPSTLRWLTYPFTCIDVTKKLFACHARNTTGTSSSWCPGSPTEWPSSSNSKPPPTRMGTCNPSHLQKFSEFPLTLRSCNLQC